MVRKRNNTLNNMERLMHVPRPPTPGSEGPHACSQNLRYKGVPYFSCDKVRPENCKKEKRGKKGVFDFSPGDFFKKGVVFLSLSLDA